MSLFLGKVVIDEASALIEQGGVENPLAVTLGNSRLLWSVAIALGLNLIVDSVDAVGSSLFASLRDRVEGFVRGQVLDKVAYIGITAFGGEQGSEIALIIAMAYIIQVQAAAWHVKLTDRVFGPAEPALP